MRPTYRQSVAIVLATLLVLEAAGIAAVVWAERSAQRADDARISVFQRAGSAWKKRLASGSTSAGPPRHGEKGGPAARDRLAEPILLPPSLAAAEAHLGPDDMVIGVEVGGKAKAYRFASFETKSGHLVNDLVGGVPVSVAYCDLTECLRVYSGPRGPRPLDLNVAGNLNGEMIMRHNETMYFHKSGQEVEPGSEAHALPLPLITPTVTTWKEWRARHPDTRVYLGPPDDDSTGPRKESGAPGR